MTPLRRLELRLLRECGQQLEQARRHAKRFLNGWTCYDPLACPTMARFLTQAALTAQVATLEREREELLTALDGIVEPTLHREDDPCAAFEENAAAFYATYHMLAPGKSEPLELANDERDAKRHNIWRDWCNHRRIEAIGRYRAARALVRRVRGGT